jgi:hypothetical protein
VGLDIIGLKACGLADVVHRQIVPPHLKSQDTEEVQGKEIARVRLKDLPVTPLR